MSSLVIVGGGYGGVWAALGAVRQIELAGGVGGPKVRLVAREPFLTARPRLYEKGLTADEAQIPLRPVLDAVGVELIEAEASTVDGASRNVRLADGRSISFDALVLAAGSVAAPPAIEGFDMHGFGVDNWPQAQRLWRRLAALSHAAPRIAVIGAGFTGLELATEIAGWRDTSAVGARITLLDRSPMVASGYAGEARDFILESLARYRVEVRCGAVVSAITPDQLLFEDGASMGCDVAIWAGGLRPSVLAGTIGASHTADGRLRTDRKLRIAAGLFAAGDVAAVPLPDGHDTVMSCQHALSTGSFAGHNAVRELLGLDLVDYAPLPYVTCLDMGPAGALLTSGFERSLKIAGPQAKPIKQNINRRIIVPPVEGGREALLAAATLERKRSLPT